MNASHDDILYAPLKTPEISVKSVVMHKNGESKEIFSDYLPTPWLLDQVTSVYPTEKFMASLPKGLLIILFFSFSFTKKNLEAVPRVPSVPKVNRVGNVPSFSSIPKKYVTPAPTAPKANFCPSTNSGSSCP